MNTKTFVSGVALCLVLGACQKASAPQWTRITTADPGTGPAFYLDTANISRKGGTPYVILQTRYADSSFGMIRAEANCGRRKLEPTALKEAVYDAKGALIDNRMVTMSGEDEQAVLKTACAA